MEQILRLNEFFVEGGKQNLSHVLLHITEPSTPEEAKKGYFFALCEMNNGDVNFITKLQGMIDRAENEYYELPEEGEKNIFELVLEKMNGEAYVLDQIRENLHCIVGAIRHKEIIFSYFGKPHLLLFYKNKLGLYEKMDLIKNNAAEAIENEEDQIFSQIVQGKLSSNDYLFVGTPHITDFFSHDRLEKIITTRSAQQSAQHIEKVLSELKNGFSFGGLIINLFQSEVIETVVAKKSPVVSQGSSTKSLNNLFSKEQATAETLSPSILPKLDKIKNILRKDPENTPMKIIPTEENVPAEINSSHVSHRLGKIEGNKIDWSRYLKIVGRGAWSVLIFLGHWLFNFFLLIYTIIHSVIGNFFLLLIAIVNYQNRRSNIIEGWRLGWRGFRNNIIHLPLATKLLLIGSILLAAGFGSSLLFIQYRQTIAEKAATLAKIDRQLETKFVSIESSIIYKDDNLAFAEYKSAGEILSQLNCESKEEKTLCAKWQKQFAEFESKLRKVSIVTSTMLADWSEYGNSAPNQIVRLKNKLIGYSNSTSSLFAYDTSSSGTDLLLTYPAISGFTEAGVPKENDYALFLYNKNQFMELNAEDMTTKLVDISFENKAEVSSFVIYNRRLYNLDTLNNSIFRHDTIKTGFGQGKNWLKTQPDLKDGFDMAVDGDLYVTKNDGEIQKYSSGNPQPFAITGLDPTLSSKSVIWTYTDIPYIYILESSQKRLLIVEKNGHLLSQITSPQFVNPTGLSIDTISKTAYIIDSGKLFKLQLTF